MTYENGKVANFLKEFGERCKEKITDIHIGDISRSKCRKWRLLVVHLGLEAIIVSDIEREVASEEERRCSFFSQWRNEKGNEATYKALIEALLEIKCVSDAESVCDLLARKGPHPPVGTKVEAKKTSEANQRASDCFDPLVLEDLAHELRCYRDDIQTQFAFFVSFIQEKLVTHKAVTVSNLRFFLLHLPALTSEDDDKHSRLLYGVKSEFQKATTVDDILLLLSKYTSFLDYHIYKSITAKYKIDIESEEAEYMEHLKEYVNKHRISDLVNEIPNMCKHSDQFTDASKTLVFKLNIKMSCKFAEVFTLKSAIAKILGFHPSALRLVSIKRGSVILVFSIPASAARHIFTADKRFTAGEKKQFKALSVEWLEYEGRCFDFSEDSEDQSKKSNIMKQKDGHQVKDKKDDKFGSLRKKFNNLFWPWRRKKYFQTGLTENAKRVSRQRYRVYEELDELCFIGTDISGLQLQCQIGIEYDPSNPKAASYSRITPCTRHMATYRQHGNFHIPPLSMYTTQKKPLSKPTSRSDSDIPGTLKTKTASSLGKTAFKSCRSKSMSDIISAKEDEASFLGYGSDASGLSGVSGDFSMSHKMPQYSTTPDNSKWLKMNTSSNYTSSVLGVGGSQFSAVSGGACSGMFTDSAIGNSDLSSNSESHRIPPNSRFPSSLLLRRRPIDGSSHDRSSDSGIESFPLERGALPRYPSSHKYSPCTRAAGNTSHLRASMNIRGAHGMQFYGPNSLFKSSHPPSYRSPPSYRNFPSYRNPPSYRSPPSYSQHLEAHCGSANSPSTNGHNSYKTRRVSLLKNAPKYHYKRSAHLGLHSPSRPADALSSAAECGRHSKLNSEKYGSLHCKTKKVTSNTLNRFFSNSLPDLQKVDQSKAVPVVSLSCDNLLRSCSDMCIGTSISQLFQWMKRMSLQRTMTSLSPLKTETVFHDGIVIKITEC